MPTRASLTLTLFALTTLTAACTGDDSTDDAAGTETGDGDGDPGDGDGAPGDGDGAPGDGDGAPGDGDGDGAPGDGDGAPASCTGDAVPQTEAELIAWLEGGGYQGWAAESAVHGSTGPHFGGVRTFVDTCLFDSLDAAATEHPRGSASVKELYGAGDQVLGWAVMVKVTTGAGGDTWYWFEVYNDTIYADGVGDSLCTTCHGGGVDYFLSPWPLQ